MQVRSALIPMGMLLLVPACAAAPAPDPVVVVPAAAPTAAPNPSAPEHKDFRPAPDVVADDASLSPSTVRVSVVDADGEPMPRAPITFETVVVRAPSSGLDVLAKDTAVADEKGTAIFRKVRAGDDQRYVVSTRRGDGEFSVEPFALSATSGKRVTVHAYETVRDLTHALVVLQTMTGLEVHADTIDVEVSYRLYNIGRVAWVPADVHVAFPPRVTGFMVSDLGLPVRTDAITDAGFALVGTVAPGTHELNYSYRIPRDPGGTQRIVLDQPPRVAQAQVILAANGAARLTVAGFPAPTAITTQSGIPVLMTDRKMTAAEGGLKSLDITLAGDPR